MTTTTNNAYNLILETTAIIEACDSIQQRGKQLDEDIQLAAMSVINHLEQHGDITLAQRLYDSMPRGSRRNALVEWFLSFGKLKLNEDQATKKTKVFLFDRTKVTNLEGGNLKPWYECKKEKAPDEEFNLLAQLARLVKMAEKAQNDGKPVIGGDFLSEMKSRIERGERVITEQQPESAETVAETTESVTE